MMLHNAVQIKMSSLMPFSIKRTQTILCTLLVVAGTLLCFQETNAQSALVHNRLRQVLNGNIAEVRKELPELISEFPDDPGVLFLKGILTEDATTALPMFEQITREYPQSEWADDAQWRVVQYYALKRDTARAVRELNTYKRNYPMSEFLIHAVDIVKSTVGTQQTVPAKTASTPITASTLPVTKVQSKEQLSKESPTQPLTVENEKAKLKEIAKKPTTQVDKANTGTTKQETSIARPVVTPTIIKPQVKILDLSASPSAETKSSEPKLTPSVGGRTVPSSTISTPQRQSQQLPQTVTQVSDNSTSDKKYGLQIGVFSTREVADSEAKKYRDQRLRVDLLDKGEGKYAVVIGNYSSKESATNSMVIVQAQCQCTPYLIEK